MNIGLLRKIEDDEVELMRTWRNAPKVRANMYSRHEIGVEEHRRWWNGIQASPLHAYFMYEIGGVPTGIVAFTGIDRVNENSSWAFYAAPEAPQGTGTCMEFLALEHAFGPLGLHKLQCEVLAFNTPVIKLHQKFGFKVEGIFREQHRVDEAFVDIYRLGMLKSEWAELRSPMETKIAAFTRRG